MIVVIVVRVVYRCAITSAITTLITSDHNASPLNRRVRRRPTWPLLLVVYCLTSKHRAGVS